MRKADHHSLPVYSILLRKVREPQSFCLISCSDPCISCRRKDGNKPLSQASTTIDSPLSSPRGSYLDLRHNSDILPQRSPTMARPSSIAFSDSSDTSIFDSRPQYGRTKSEAAAFLSQFQSYGTSPEQPKRRPTFDRGSASHSTTPSLSHTPGSFTSPGSSYASSRPLQSRPYPHASSFGSKSINLVTPMSGLPAPNSSRRIGPESASLQSGASTSTAFRVAQGELSYDKKLYISPGQGSLKQLFSHDAMKAAPKLPIGLARYEYDDSDDSDAER